MDSGFLMNFDLEILEILAQKSETCTSGHVISDLSNTVYNLYTIYNKNFRVDH